MFTGFTSQETFTQIPDSFFELLNDICDLDELKTTLYVLWRIEHAEGRFRALRAEDIEADSALGQNFSAEQVRSGLQKALRRGTLIRAQHPTGEFFFLNSPRGRLSAEALQKGLWQPGTQPPPRVWSNIFRLYEQNIGALTPLVADALREAEKEYPPDWLTDAFTQAATRNKRNWKYVEAILKRWKEEGRDAGKNNQSAEANADRYTANQFADFLKPD